MLHNITWGDDQGFQDPGVWAWDARSQGSAGGVVGSLGGGLPADLSPSVVVTGLEDIDASTPTPEGRPYIVR